MSPSIPTNRHRNTILQPSTVASSCVVVDDLFMFNILVVCYVMSVDASRTNLGSEYDVGALGLI
jgi:hypothetical protein